MYLKVPIKTKIRQMVLMIDDPKADLMHGKPYPFLTEVFRVRHLDTQSTRHVRAKFVAVSASVSSPCPRPGNG